MQPIHRVLVLCVSIASMLLGVVSCSRSVSLPAPASTRFLDHPEALTIESRFAAKTSLADYLGGAELLADGSFGQILGARGATFLGDGPSVPASVSPSVSWIDSLLVPEAKGKSTGPARLDLVQFETHSLMLHWLVLECRRALAPGEAAFVLDIESQVSSSELHDPVAVERLLRTHAGFLARMTPEGRFDLDHALAATIDPDKPASTILVGVVTRGAPLTDAHLRLVRLDRQLGWLLTGGDPGDPSAIRSMTIGPSTRRAIVFGTKGSVSRDVTIPLEEPMFRCAIAIPGADPPIPCTIELRFHGEDGTNEVIPAVAQARASDWYPIDQTLPNLAGKSGRLEIAVAAQGAPEASMILLADPVLEGGAKDARKDIVIISIDTARYDRFSLYGNPRATTPNIDRLAATSIVFENATSAAPWTLPSHVSIFSGQVSDRHGVHGSKGRISPTTPWLPSALQRAGYRTLAFTGGGYVNPEFGFARGFECYSVTDCAYPSAEWAWAIHNRSASERAARTDVERARLLELLGSPRRRPLALFVHTYAAHNYSAPPSVLKALGASEADVPKLLGLDPAKKLTNDLTTGAIPAADRQKKIDDGRLVYDAALRTADSFVGEIVARLEQEKRLDDVILVVLGDHGEELGDREGFGHGQSLFDELIRVPLIIRVPGKPARRVKDVAGLVDVVPTILELLGIEDPEFQGNRIDGRSLVGLIDGQTREVRPVLSRGDRHDEILRSLRGRRDKVIESSIPGGVATRELYDLLADPGERSDLAKERADNAAKLGGLLSQTVADAIARSTGSRDVAMSSALEEQLRQLGYLGGN